MEECLRAKGGRRSGGIDSKRFLIREDCVLANGFKQRAFLPHSVIQCILGHQPFFSFFLQERFLLHCSRYSITSSLTSFFQTVYSDSPTAIYLSFLSLQSSYYVPHQCSFAPSSFSGLALSGIIILNLKVKKSSSFLQNSVFYKNSKGDYPYYLQLQTRQKCLFTKKDSFPFFIFPTIGNSF